jgi:hypothetical protein
MMQINHNKTCIENKQRMCDLKVQCGAWGGKLQVGQEMAMSDIEMRTMTIKCCP